MFNRRLITSHKKNIKKPEKNTPQMLCLAILFPIQKMWSQAIDTRNHIDYSQIIVHQSVCSLFQEMNKIILAHITKKTNSNFFLFLSVFIRQCERLFSRFHSSFALWVINLPTTHTNFVRFFSLNPLYGLIWFCFGSFFSFEMNSDILVNF